MFFFLRSKLSPTLQRTWQNYNKKTLAQKDPCTNNKSTLPQNNGVGQNGELGAYSDETLDITGLVRPFAEEMIL